MGSLETPERITNKAKFVNKQRRVLVDFSFEDGLVEKKKSNYRW